jgi:hypothetical protein
MRVVTTVGAVVGAAVAVAGGGIGGGVVGVGGLAVGSVVGTPAVGSGAGDRAAVGVGAGLIGAETQLARRDVAPAPNSRRTSRRRCVITDTYPT